MSIVDNTDIQSSYKNGMVFNSGKHKKVFADAIVMRLWVAGLISTEERDMIFDKNNIFFI